MDGNYLIKLAPVYLWKVYLDEVLYSMELPLYKEGCIRVMHQARCKPLAKPCIEPACSVGQQRKLRGN
jgi:hypothetical protein